MVLFIREYMEDYLGEEYHYKGFNNYIFTYITNF